MNYDSIEKALEAKQDLVERIQSIDLQLNEKLSTMSEADYEQWRVRALKARNSIVTKLQRTKMWIQKRREEESRERINSRGNGDGLFADLYSLTKSLVGEGADISPEEQALLDDCRAYLQDNKERNV